MSHTIFFIFAMSTIALTGMTPIAQAAVVSQPFAYRNIVDQNKRKSPKILSSAWGSHASTSCPGRSETDFDNIPVTFNWFIKPSSVKETDFVIYKEDGSTTQPVCALQFPPNESDELQTVNLIGYFGKPVNGKRPTKVRVIGNIQGKPPGSHLWRKLGRLPAKKITQLEAPPFIVDAWIIPPKIYVADANRCKVGTKFVRVMWSNGITAYPTGEEVGEAVVSSYRAIFKLPSGKKLEITPLSVADLNDHASSAMADNMHDLCLPAIPYGSQLSEISIGKHLVQDPNGDTNETQHFLVR